MSNHVKEGVRQSFYLVSVILLQSDLLHQQYVILVSSVCQFSLFPRFWETWTPGKVVYTTISKGSSQGLTYLGLTW